MGIKDRFFGSSKKQANEIENPTTIDIQPSPLEETSSEEAEKGFIKQIKQMWNKFRKDSYSEEISTVKSETEKKAVTPDIKVINCEVETENNRETNKKNRLQSLIQNIFRKNSDAPSKSSDKNTIEEAEKPVINEQPVKTNYNQNSHQNPNKIKKLFKQLTQKEKEQMKTEEVLEEVEVKLEKTSNSGQIKNIFHQLVKSVNTDNIQKNIQKISEKLPSMNRGPIKEIWPKIQSLFQMVLDPKAGWTSKALAIGALLYLISPFDAIPDVIPIAGLTDDAAVIVSVVSTLAFELSKYAQQSASKGIEVAEELADIEVRKYNRIVRITLTGSIIAAILAIAVKIILKHI
ncbi:MAG: YkvA family protein [Cyanobacteria bacterium J06632_19]